MPSVDPGIGYTIEMKISMEVMHNLGGKALQVVLRK
jgi:hypothetical protein